jgi:predicted component of type VI protein secretion system
MNRNQERVLSDAMILDIKDSMFIDLVNVPDSVYHLVDSMMNAYLTDDWDSLKQAITENIEHYEDEIILTLNMELIEDSFNQAENDN